MKQVTLQSDTDFEGWRRAARSLAAAGVRPEEICWNVGMPDLFGASLLDVTSPPEGDGARIDVPRAFPELAQTVIQANNPQRFALLYAALWRIARGERHLLDVPTDPLLHRLNALAKSVRRDTHKMRAFLRFREARTEAGIEYVAWFEPEHHIIDANADFFQRRFASMNWAILTPRRCLRWDGRTLFAAPGADRSLLPKDDGMKEYWDIYFTSIFNPARLKVKAMTSEMPRKFWKNMPEAALIPELTRSAARRTSAMMEAGATREKNHAVTDDGENPA